VAAAPAKAWVDEGMLKLVRVFMAYLMINVLLLGAARKGWQRVFLRT